MILIGLIFKLDIGRAFRRNPQVSQKRGYNLKYNLFYSCFVFEANDHYESPEIGITFVAGSLKLKELLQDKYYTLHKRPKG